jgi:hypothetical protein
MADEPEPGKAHPVLRLFAGFGCLVFLSLAVLFFPLGGLADQPWHCCCYRAGPPLAMTGPVEAGAGGR